MKLDATSLSRIVFPLLLAAAAPACGGPSYHPLTPAQLAQRGTRRYPNLTREQATKASAAALATLGFEVTVTDVSAGVVRTAPKVIQVSAVGGYGYASAIEDGLAWSVHVDSAGKDAVVHCTPRAFRNGTEMHDPNVWVAEAIDDKFRDFWHELDGDLHEPGEVLLAAFADAGAQDAIFRP
jgi:hypothetical protein